MNTTDFLSIATAICPERDAIVFERNRWTYALLLGDFPQVSLIIEPVGE